MNAGAVDWYWFATGFCAASGLFLAGIGATALWMSRQRQS